MITKGKRNEKKEIKTKHPRSILVDQINLQVKLKLLNSKKKKKSFEAKKAEDRTRRGRSLRPQVK